VAGDSMGLAGLGATAAMFQPSNRLESIPHNKVDATYMATLHPDIQPS